MDQKKISVIIPTYNRGYCIKRSIESVLQQIYLTSLDFVMYIEFHY